MLNSLVNNILNYTNEKLNFKSNKLKNLLFQTETGRIGLEGCLCQDFYRIRDLLYEQYAIV